MKQQLVGPAVFISHRHQLLQNYHYRFTMPKIAYQHQYQQQDLHEVVNIHLLIPIQDFTQEREDTHQFRHSQQRRKHYITANKTRYRRRNTKLVFQSKIMQNTLMQNI